jgi:hypothetical protein
MGDLSQYALQAALHQALSSDTALMDAVTGIYDFVPADTAYPYVTLGSMRGSDISAVAVQLTQIDVTIHVYSRERGRKEAAEIMRRLQTVLEEEAPEPEGFGLVTLRLLNSEITQERDGLTYHGRMQWRAVLQQE